LQLAGTQYASSLDLLRLFAYGTLKDYKSKIRYAPLPFVCVYQFVVSVLCGSLPDPACDVFGTPTNLSIWHLP
jgi:hypothetical protein